MPIKGLMRSDLERRKVAFDAASGTLTVGDRAVELACHLGDNECLLRTYLDLVAEQRAIALGRGVHLRRDDIAVLAELLDLDDADLEARLRRILHLSDTEAADLHRRMRRQRFAAAAVGVGLLAGVPVSRAVAGAEAAAVGPASKPAAFTVEVPHVSPDAIDRALTVEMAAPVVVAADEAPAPESETEVGYTVRYERDPSYTPPEGVEIGDAMVIERDAP